MAPVPATSRGVPVAEHNTSSTASPAAVFGSASGFMTVISQKGAPNPITFDFLGKGDV